VLGYGQGDAPADVGVCEDSEPQSGSNRSPLPTCCLLLRALSGISFS
jgi:hypothetical protein